MNIDTRETPLDSADGHRWILRARIPPAPRAALLWSPALGVAARHYPPFADALAARGIATFLHEWRGHGSSSVRAGHDMDWAYRELLEQDLPVSQASVRATLPGLPLILGGHSLGGQISACRLALAPDSASRLWLIGSGAPFPAAFGLRLRLLLPLAFRLTPWLAKRFGALPGRRIGFGGREAHGVMRDWAGTGRASAYRIASLGRDLTPVMPRVQAPIDAVVLEHDWYAPENSLRALTGHLGGRLRVHHLGDAELPGHADHFRWMRTPEAVAKALAESLPY
ncbi:alpha/beta fold hydrolase [Lysobacter pythonis]|uniref:Alpha/beta fold hydrolase n=1 Tax=Solilutibacter pythonis TaxID=2483112 RepID=A0A3M2HYU9_9GAMM|nr:alpha/beta fold hydrolase [Lysobacter pythonis]RMH93023.1 alpha/beta fold hydrolase [Lysobacter pythonis]